MLVNEEDPTRKERLFWPSQKKESAPVLNTEKHNTCRKDWTYLENVRVFYV